MHASKRLSRFYRASVLFFEILRSRVLAPWMARERQRHTDVPLARPDGGGFQKMAQPPVGQNGSKKDFCLLLVFLKVGPPAGHTRAIAASRQRKSDSHPQGMSER